MDKFEELAFGSSFLRSTLGTSVYSKQLSLKIKKQIDETETNPITGVKGVLEQGFPNQDGYYKMFRIGGAVTVAAGDFGQFNIGFTPFGNTTYDSESQLPPGKINANFQTKTDKVRFVGGED